jgi:hypothetical protein
MLMMILHEVLLSNVHRILSLSSLVLDVSLCIAAVRYCGFKLQTHVALSTMEAEYAAHSQYMSDLTSIH